MHFRGNKSIVGDSLLSYLPVPQFSRSDMRCNNYCSLSASFAISIIRKAWRRETWPHVPMSLSSNFREVCIIAHPAFYPPNHAFSQVFNFYLVSRAFPPTSLKMATIFQTRKICVSTMVHIKQIFHFHIFSLFSFLSTKLIFQGYLIICFKLARKVNPSV